MNIHKSAFILATAMLVLFCSVVFMYQKWGGGFVVRLYEAHQILLAEDRTGRRKIQEYEDLLRVKPDSFRGRGLLVNALLEENDATSALLIAHAGIERATKEHELTALLILGRAQLTAGRLEEAAKTQKLVTTKFSESGEAAYQKAHLHILRGEFEDAWNAYSVLREYGARNSTEEFVA